MLDILDKVYDIKYDEGFKPRDEVEKEWAASLRPAQNWCVVPTSARRL